MNKRRKLGQHFLVDEEIAERIVNESGVSQGGRVLEIGPGKGILTRKLLDKGAFVHAVELDKELYARLRKELGRAEKFSIEWGNALKFDFGSIEAPCHVVSNLPYSVAVPIIKMFFERLDKVVSMTLMAQSEVVDRLTAKPGDSAYGSLSIFTAYHCDTRRLFTVPAEAFRPRPKVESAVIKLLPLNAPRVTVSGKDEFFDFVQTSFRQRRKTIRNNLKRLWPDSDALEKSCGQAGIDLSLRPQAITIQQYAALFGRWEREGAPLNA